MKQQTLVRFKRKKPSDERKHRFLIETANLVKYQLARKEGHKTARTFKVAVSYLMHKDNIGRQRQIEI